MFRIGSRHSLREASPLGWAAILPDGFDLVVIGAMADEAAPETELAAAERRS
jgi:hypothetical protein